MRKKLPILLSVICLLFAGACLAEEENQVDVTLEGYMEAGGLLNVTWTEEAYETGGLGLIGMPGQTIGEVLKSNDVLSVEPVLEGDEFEGWMEVAITVTADEDGFEWEEYSPIPDQLYTTEELMALAVPEHRVMYVAKWAAIPAEEYFAPYEEEMTVFPSITLLSGEGMMLFDGEDEQYESTMRVTTVEPGQTFGEALELDTLASVTAEGKTFAGWMIYEYGADTMETSEAPMEEDGVLCFELFESYHMVLREYMSCVDPLSTEELAAYVCEESDHLVVAVWKATEEYLTSIKEQADAIKDSLEHDELTQANMNLESEKLRALWDEALTKVLEEAAKVLPEEKMAKLTAEQSAWAETMKAAVETAGKEYEGGSVYALVVNMEAAGLTEERVFELYELLK